MYWPPGGPTPCRPLSEAFHPPRAPKPPLAHGLPPPAIPRRRRRVHPAFDAYTVLVSPPPPTSNTAEALLQYTGGVTRNIPRYPLLGASSRAKNDVPPVQTANEIQIASDRPSQQGPAVSPSTANATTDIHEVHITGELK